MGFGERHLIFLQKGLEVLLDTLLRVEANGVVVPFLPYPPFAQSRGVITLGFFDLLPDRVLHRESCLRSK